MLQVKLLGQFDVQRDGTLLGIPARAAQSLFAYLLLTPGTMHRREKLAGLLWPNTSDENARSNLRHELWRLRKAIETKTPRKKTIPYLLIDEISIGFNADSAYWLDASIVQKPLSDIESADNLIETLSLYRGELLPGLYDEWVMLERERVSAVFEQKMARLLELLVEKKRWKDILDWSERWIALGQTPEPAYRALMLAHSASGNRSQVAAVYERCVRAMRDDLGVEPSEQTRKLFEQLSKKDEPAKPIETRTAINLTPQPIRESEIAKELAATIGSPSLARSNLPVPLTSFIGREREIVEIKRLLSSTRLLTLTGSGGCGKTRLALQVVAELFDSFPNGIWFVDLAPLSDSSFVPQAIATVFDLHQISDTPISILLQNFFRAKNLLLILDNCEHLIQACAELSDTLLHACPDLKILATSREALGVTGEAAYRVPSLAIPDLQQLPPIESLSQNDAVRLFIDRANSVQSAFSVNDQNALAVAQICHRLDGIPLALELAAARVKVFSAEEIEARLDDRFHLLTGASRTAMPRQQTLRAAIDWSFDLLSESERVLLRRLSVFAGGWTFNAAESVCSLQNVEGSDGNLPTTNRLLPTDILDLLSHLIDKSLVLAEEQDGVTRYRMLETIREYALAKLRDAGETDLIHARHLDFFLHWAEEVAPNLVGPDPLKWLRQLDIEYDNLRVALRTALEDKATDKGLRLVCALYGFWFVRGFFSEERALAALFLSSSDGMDSRTKLICARVLYQAGWIAILQNDYATGDSQLRESIALCQELGDDRGTAQALVYLCFAELIHGNSALARSLIDQALALLQPQGERRTLALALIFHGLVLREQGDYTAARASMHKALALRRELDDKRGIAGCLMDIGTTAYVQGDPSAESLLETSLKMSEELADQFGIPRCLHDLGEISLSHGDLVRARVRFAQGLQIFRDQGDKRNAIQCLEGLAGVAAANSQVVDAARLLGAAQDAREAMGVPLPVNCRANYDRTLWVVRQRLDEATLAATWAEGRAMTMEQAIAYALDVKTSIPKE